MKTLYKALVINLMLMAAACSGFEELNKDPNNPTEIAPVNLLNGVIMDSWDDPWDITQRYCQFYTTGHKLYGHQNYLLGRYEMNYTQLRNIDRMVYEAGKRSTDEMKAYPPIAKFYRAFYFVRMSERLGDIPMSEAMKGISDGNFTPHYDTQKEVYLQCLNLLEEANTEIGECVGRFNGNDDLYFGGDLLKWQKSINSFRLRVLMSLSKKTGDSDLDIKGQFNRIVSNPANYPLMTSAADNMKIVYPGGNSDRYPLYPDDTKGRKQRDAIGETYLRILKRSEDPRIFVQMEPGDAINVGVPDREKLFSSYFGAEVGEDMSLIAQGLNTGQYATVSYSLYVTPTGIPCVQLGYPELQFTIAEAINRGWISGDAATHYRNGIQADMEFYGISQAEIDRFLSRSEIGYKGNDADGLRQILEQKYVAFFQNSGYQAFFDQRRTGIPEFHVGPGNDNGRIPLRWMYPEDELLMNKENLETALQRQFGGSDDINDRMWLIND
ncbi:MAG: SusD/RagB family nutrient-binding outer membrane lipoprotein [Mediterranea sp.]|nr:SusD/RagB family nutrient-binding outer membrane lipoprotein [Mediterranea sp.]